VLHGLQGVKASGTSYLPNLNKFIGYCNESGEGDSRPGERFSEQTHGGKLKPTPNGVPLCWTVGSYTDDELRASPCIEDQVMADQTGGQEWTHADLREQAR
jgi:hypothetical protein